MIITKTPFRISFFGGGTDFQQYFSKHQGMVLSTTIDKYCYVTVRNLSPFFDFNSEFVYSQIERVNSTQEIKHPAIRNSVNMLNVNNIRLVYEADLPARSGLGTSSSFSVGMLNAFYQLKRENKTKKQLAKDAIYLERNLCNERGGWQDQIAASYGGFNKITFYDNKFNVAPISMNPNRKQLLNNNILMFFTGFTRFSSEIHKTYKTVDHNFNILKKMYDLTKCAESILLDNNKNLDDFGCLLNQEWQLKKSMGNYVTTKHIDDIYDKAIANGALGGKLLGAGGGGFMIFYVNEKYKQQVLDALKQFLYVPIAFENDGTRVVYDSDSIHN